MGNKKNKAAKSTKLYCLRKDGMYLAWDEKSMTEKPQEGARLSRTLCERKYKDYEMIPFPEAYEQWWKAKYPDQQWMTRKKQETDEQDRNDERRGD